MFRRLSLHLGGPFCVPQITGRLKDPRLSISRIDICKFTGAVAKHLDLRQGVTSFQDGKFFLIKRICFSFAIPVNQMLDICNEQPLVGSICISLFNYSKLMRFLKLIRMAYGPRRLVLFYL